MKQILSLHNDALYMVLDKEQLFYTYDRKIGNINLTDPALVLEKEVLGKSGKYRQCLPIGDKLYLKAFCDIYEFDSRTLEPLRMWTLGENLSSDINVIRHDNGNLYASIRNGSMAVIDLLSGEVMTRQVASTSMWDFATHENSLLAGTVNGEILQIHKNTLEVIQIIPAHKKNCKSLLLQGDCLYSASQDLSIKKWNLTSWQEEGQAKSCHRKMFEIVGIFKKYLLTCSPPCREMKFWDLETLELSHTLPFASDAVVIHNSKLIFAKRDGIYEYDLDF